MKKFALFLVVVALAGTVQAQELTQVWASEPVFRTPESVNYDPARHVLYVSNINGNPSAKDGNGFLSRILPDGKILNLKWVTGLNAPKGAAQVGARLYVSDIDVLVVVDIEARRVIKRIPFPGARFLNDVTADDNGTLYVSDSSGKNSVVYRVRQDNPEVWLQPPVVRSPNGLAVEGDKLLVGNTGDGSLLRVDLRTKKVDVVAKVGFGIDGLKPDGKGGYILSDWRGSVFYLTSGRELKKLLEPQGERVNAADIEYLPGRHLVLVPTFFDNRVVAYRLR